MPTILKNRKKIIITALSVIISLALIALAVIIGTTPFDSHGADTYAGDAGVTGASNANSTYSKLIKIIDSATTYAELNTAITTSVAQSLSCDGVQYAMKHLADRKSSGKVTDMTDSQYTTLYNKLKDNYQEKYLIDDKNGNGTIESGEYSGRYLSGTYNLPFDRTISDRTKGGFVWGVADGGCTFTGTGSSVLRIRSDYITFHGGITIDGGHTLTIQIDNSTLETYITNSKESNPNFSLGTLIKREVEGALRVTSSGANKGLVPANADNGIVKQYSGPLFHIKNGTLIIKGSSGRAVTISGAGNFKFDYTDVSDGNAGLEFPPSDALGSSDDVIASGPLVLANGSAKMNKIDFDYVNMYSNYNASTEGGCFRIADCTPDVSLTNCRFQKFYSAKSGSFMDLGTQNGGGVTMTNCSVYDCYAASKENTTQGATLRTYGMNNAFLNMDGCYFYQNWNNCQSTITWSSLLANQTVDGQSTGCYIKDCRIYNNVSLNGSAGVHNAGRMIILNTEIDHNTTLYGGGGGVTCSTWASSSDVSNFSIQHDGNLTLGTGVKIHDNKALQSSGGGILVTCGVIGVNTGNSTPRYFPKKGDGSSYEMRVIVDGAEIYYNQAIYGGGISISKSDYRGTASGHQADQDNSDYVVKFEMKSGGVYNNTAKQGVNKEGNTLSGFGGAVYLNDRNGTGNTVDFIMTGGRMVNNKATTEYSSGSGSRGGAVYVEGGGSFYMSGGYMSNNTSYHIGGAVCVYGGNVTISDQANLNENRAYRSGGAVYVLNGNITVDGGTVSGNRACETDASDDANSTGGAFFISGENAVVEIDNGLIDSNLAAGSGGAAFIDTGGTMLLKGGTISNNTTKKSGGVVKIIDGLFHMEDGTVVDNTATDSGGVAFVQGKGGIVTIKGGTLSRNRAQNYFGGVIYVSGGSVSITDGIITDNYAARYGGAITAESYTDGNGTLFAPKFSMTGGTLSGNSTDGMGGAIYVSGASSFEIGYQGCYGDGVKDGNGDWLHSPENAPVIQNNTANEGGGIYVSGGDPIIYCGKIYGNHALAVDGVGGNGGGICVSNAGITVDYADILENDATTKGGGIYVNSSTKNVTVLLDSGFVCYNTADVGAGIGVDVSGSYVATITIGRNGCDGDPASDHKHPQITHNIATTKGGGLYFVSTSANGIVFTMYCGLIGENTANANMSSGNILQQGGTISIAGDYSIENATVFDGTYLRPTISTDTLIIKYNYNNTDYSASNAAVSTVTVAVGDDNRMFINLPTVDGKYGGKMLVRWELELSDGSRQSFIVGERIVLNQNTYPKDSTLNFYGIWLAVGDAYLEPSYVTTGKVFSPILSGLPYAFGNISNPFTVQFSISEFNPYELGNRNLQFNKPAPAGTVIYMLYFRDTVTDFYYYNAVGDELKIDIEAFRRLGDPETIWENTVNAPDSRERFIFIFDFARCETATPGTVQITLERNYDEAKVGEVRAPLTQVISYSMDEAYMPTLTPSASETKPDTDVTLSYDAGIASDSTSLYYGEQASLVIRDPDGKLDGEAYITVNGVKYFKNSVGVFIVSLGAANIGSEHTLSLHSASLAYREDRSVSLTASLYITPDAEKPLVSPCVDSFEITFVADALPAVSISLPERVFYTDELSEKDVQVSKEEANTDGCTLIYGILKLSDGVYSAEAAQNEGVSISDAGAITFGNATAGTYRITLTVKRGDTVITQIPYNFIILDR